MQLFCGWLPGFFVHGGAPALSRAVFARRSKAALGRAAPTPRQPGQRATGVPCKAQQQRAQAQVQSALDLVALYKALGGGWEPYQQVQLPDYSVFGDAPRG